MNVIDQSILVLQQLRNWGCEQVCVCPGGRNAPFVEVLSKTSQWKVKSFFEERSASFYALGLIKKIKKPVAIITTSGTAVAEVLPAVIEAYYSGLPLIVVSADRPKSFRGSGSPQAIEQSTLFSGFVQFQLDLESDLEKLTSHDFHAIKPIHINICFDEPLLPPKALKESYDSFFVSSKEKNLSVTERKPNDFKKEIEFFFRSIKKPLVILSSLKSEQKEEIKKSLLDLKAPIYAEAHSGLQNDNELKPYLVTSGDGFLNQAFVELGIDSVIRIGGVPTLRLWRNLEKQKGIKVINFSDQDFTGLSWLQSKNYQVQDFHKVKLVNKVEPFDHYKLVSANLKMMTEYSECFQRYPQSEQNFVKNISENLQINSNLFLGNSLPIREWDFANQSNKNLKIYTSRGTNGIDGLLSTFFGICDSKNRNYCLLGDLSALYDLNGAWIYKQYLQDYPVKIIIINNGGGKIFSPLFKNSFFENNHDINFKPWAQMFGLSYQGAKNCEEINWNIDSNEVIEIFPDNSQTLAFLTDYQQKVDKIFNEKI